MSENLAIPVIDLSPFFIDDDETGKKKVIENISKASLEYGFFEIVNHGVPLDLMNHAINLSKTFFEYPDEEKNKLTSCGSAGSPLPAGYNKQPQHSADKNEYLLMFSPNSTFNVLPTNPPHFKEALEELFTHFGKVGEVLESMLNECLGLPPNLLKEYNNDRSWDFMVALSYYPATDTENNGISEHEDGNCITFVIQDNVGGLEVCKNGQWIPVIPTQGRIVVNIGDVFQVMSNNKVKSATHRVVRQRGSSRHSFAFFYNIKGDKWIEPLPQFTKDIGETPKYRGFYYKDYQALRMRNKTHPPSRPQDVIHITHYAISSQASSQKSGSRDLIEQFE